MAKNNSPDPAQYVLDFTSRHSDACRQLRTALKRIGGADLKHWSFLMLVHNLSNDQAGLVRDYEQLADLLWCSRATAIRLVNRLHNVDLIQVVQTFTADGDASKNEYRINWDRVRVLSTQAIESLGARVRSTAPSESEGGSHPETTWSQGDTTWSQGDTSLGRILPENSSCPGPNPGRRPAAGPTESFSGKGKGPQKGPASAELRMALFAEVPELAGAQMRILAPLPAGDLTYGVFARQALTIEHLKSPASIVTWHRQQLSTLKPVAGDTEADLLLTLAARMRAIEMPAKEVQNNRVAVFVTTISRGLWRLVLPFVPEAAKFLERYEQHLKGRMWLQMVPQRLPALHNQEAEDASSEF